MTKPIFIEERAIGEGLPPFIVCEAEINHDGSLSKAIEMVHKAKECGADAIKFQFIVAENIAEPKNPYFEMFKKVELSKEDFKRIHEEAKRVGITCFATVPDFETVEWAAELEFPAVKIGSTNITNLPLLGRVAKLGMPVILSTGMSTLDEVKDATGVLSESDVILLHCTVGYPIGIEDVNLNMMKSLGEHFPDHNVGFSDHTLGVLAAVLAASHGAVLIEKHFTLDKSSKGPDHHFSATPEEIKEMVDHIQKAMTIMGRREKGPTEKEKGMLSGVRRYVVAARDIKAGCIIGENDLNLKRINPSTEGIEPKFFFELMGKRLKRNVQKGEAIVGDMI